MSLTDISNAELSRRANVDPSLISRYRSGSRVLKKDSEITKSICTILWKNIRKKERINLVSEITGISRDSLSEDTLSAFLLSEDADNAGEDASIEKLFAAFDSYTSETGIVLPKATDAAPESLLNDDRSIYFGYAGLREAVLRFLGNVCLKKDKELLLYSDQSMDWLTRDSAFRLKWASLMSGCVKNGTRIRIIHNIDRSLNEMNEAIISWLPLYMSGMIEPFYFDRRSSDRFSNTLFLCPGLFAIFGSHVRGVEDSGIYYFTEDGAELRVRNKELKKLLNLSRPLVKIEETDARDLSVNEPSFKNISISIGTDEVRIIRIIPPYLSFTFTHPLMIRSFASYMNRR